MHATHFSIYVGVLLGILIMVTSVWANKQPRLPAHGLDGYA